MKPRGIAMALAFWVSLVSTSLAKESDIGETSSASRISKSQRVVVGRIGRVQQVPPRLTPMQERRLVPVLRAEALKIQGIKNNQSLSKSHKLRRLRAVQNRSNRKLRVILTRSQFQQLQANRQQRAQLIQAALRTKNSQGNAARSEAPPVSQQK